MVLGGSLHWIFHVALVQVEMVRAEAVKEKLVKFVLLGKLLYALS